jgi:hypothetical protein
MEYVLKGKKGGEKREEANADDDAWFDGQRKVWSLASAKTSRERSNWRVFKESAAVGCTTLIQRGRRERLEVETGDWRSWGRFAVF